MKFLMPSPESNRIKSALSKIQPKRLSVQEAMRQTEQHLRTGKSNLLKRGQLVKDQV